MDAKSARKAHLRLLRDELGGTKALADLAEMDANYISSILGPKAKRNLGDEVARRIEKKRGMPRGALDQAPTATPKQQLEARSNVELYPAGQQTIARMQLLADFDSLPVDLQQMVANKAAGYRELFQSLPEFVRKDFAKPGDPHRSAEWERGIEAAITGSDMRAKNKALLDEMDTNLKGMPPAVQKAAQQAQKELDKVQTKDGPRWVFVLVPDEEK